MPHRTLPDHPDLDQLKRQAKDLLRDARARDPAALARFRRLPAFATVHDDTLARERLALHDAQSVVAREHGFDSWRALSERVEETTLRFDDAVREFVLAATDGRSDRARRLLERHPGLPRASFHAALVLGDAGLVLERLRADPALALQSGGPRDWPPLLYLCHSALYRAGLAGDEGLVAIAERLLAGGADPNTRFPWLHHGVQRAVLWGATLSTGSLALARCLLQAGADPDDGVTLAIAASGGSVDALDLLLAHGADVDQPWATDGSATLYAIMQWGGTPTGIRWLLEHGADPDPVFAANGETPLHVAARRWDVPVVEALVARGADVARRRHDGRTPYVVARLNGNRTVAEWLQRHGAPVDMEPVDRLVASASEGDRAAVEAMLATRPVLRDALGPEHYAPLHRAAERGDLPALEALLACGLDPDRGDEEIGKTALHSAAMQGHAGAVRVLLAHGASPAVRDREFHGTPLVWAAEGARSHPDGDTGHEVVGRLLMDAGSPTDWNAGEEPASGLTEVLEAWRRRSD